MSAISSFSTMPLVECIDLVERVMLPLGATTIHLGGVGTGKSAGFGARAQALAAKDPHFGFCMEILSGKESVDMRGMPMPVDDTGFSLFGIPDHMRACYYRNADGRLALDGNGKPKIKPRGWMILDEITQISDPGTQNILAPILLDGGVGEHRVPRGRGAWCVTGLGNRVEDKANACRLPTLLWNRASLSNIVSPDPEGWRSWAIKAGVPLPVLIFAAREEGTVFTGKAPVTDGPFCTVRSLTNAAYALEEHARRAFPGVKGDDERDDVPAWDFSMWPEKVPLDDVARFIVAGAIGAPAAGKFFDLMRHIKDRPTIAQIVKDPKGAPLPEDNAVRFSIVDTLAVRADEKNIKPICEYVKRMPRSLMASFIRWATHRDADLTAAVGKSGLAYKAGADLSVGAFSS